MLKRTVYISGLLVLCAAIVAALTYWAIQRALQHEPAFYRAALAQDPCQQRPHGKQFERQVFELHNRVQLYDSWSIVLTEEQINAWLAIQLPNKFTAWVPEGISQPRLAIAPDGIRFAFRYVCNSWNAVITVKVEPFLTEHDDELALKISGVWAGLVPISIEPFLEQLTAAASEAGIPLRWGQEEGDPVAILTVADAFGLERFVELDTVQLDAGQIHLSGRSKRKSDQTVAVAVENLTDHH